MAFFSWFRGLVVWLLLIPVWLICLAWWHTDPQSQGIWQGLIDTVLPEYARHSLLLCLAVSVGVVSMGTVSATLVALFEFPGRRSLSVWLLMPLAMPAYGVAYAYTDFLQYSGALQTGLRAAFGWQGALWPDVRNLWGAAAVLSLSLYPYVYVLCQQALREHAGQLMEAARLLGAGMGQRIRRVAWPLARPAIAAGLALSLMETLADFGVSSYFGVPTFSTGIYKAWLVMDNPIAAAQLSSCLLLTVGVVLWWEQRAQARRRFLGRRTHHATSPLSSPTVLRGWVAALAWLACAMPVLLGFVLPMAIMVHALWRDSQAQPIPWQAFAGWCWHSLRLGAMGAALALVLAWILAHGVRTQPRAWLRWSARLAGLGYAVPGMVIVVGLLWPVGWLQSAWPDASLAYWLTGTVLGVLWAYLVRFTAVALQSLQSGYTRVPLSADESAQMLGVTGWRLWGKVHWPLLRPASAAAFLLVWVDVIKELPATLVLRPFNTDTLAVMAYQFARDERLGEAALPSLALVLAGLGPVLLMVKTQRVRH